MYTDRAFTDLVVLDSQGNPTPSVPDGFSIQVVWSGALEDPENPGQALLDSITPWTPDITDVDGLPLIRYDIRFHVTNVDFEVEDDPALPGIDDLRIRFGR